MRIIILAVLAVSTALLSGQGRVGVAAGHSLHPRAAQNSHPPLLRLTSDSSKPVFTVGIEGGFTGARMVASVYADGRVVTVRRGGNISSTPTETRVPLTRGAVQAVLDAAVRTHVFDIPRSAQDAIVGADIPVLSLRIVTTRGVRSVHVMGVGGSHAPGTAAFFPIFTLLHALAGYPPQLR